MLLILELLLEIPLVVKQDMLGLVQRQVQVINLELLQLIILLLTLL